MIFASLSEHGCKMIIQETIWLVSRITRDGACLFDFPEQHEPGNEIMVMQGMGKLCPTVTTIKKESEIN